MTDIMIRQRSNLLVGHLPLGRGAKGGEWRRPLTYRPISFPDRHRGRGLGNGPNIGARMNADGQTGGAQAQGGEWMDMLCVCVCVWVTGGRPSLHDIAAFV